MHNYRKLSESYNAKIILQSSKIKFLVRDFEITIPIKIMNISNHTWLSFKENKKNPINISYHWLDLEKNVILLDGVRTFLPNEIHPHEEIILDVTVKGPIKNTSSNLMLEFDLVHEGVTWFKDKGSQTTFLPIQILEKNPYPTLPREHEIFVNNFDLVGDTEKIAHDNNCIFELSGWIGSIKRGAPIDNISIYLDSKFLGNAKLGQKRNDISTSFEHKNCGWYKKVNIPKLMDGYHLLHLNSTSEKNTLSVSYSNRIILVENNSIIGFMGENNSDFSNHIPPPKLRKLVSGTEDIEWFIRSGALGFFSIQNALSKIDEKLENFKTILDFGCGCGRILFHLQKFSKANLFGYDYNSELIKWCQQNLQFANFKINSQNPPISNTSQKFDLIYSFSVITHLSIDSQKRWLEELSKLLCKNGVLLISTHGNIYQNLIKEEDQAKFRNGEIIVWNSLQEGKNECMSFHPSNSIKRVIPESLEISTFLPEGAYGNPYQDLYILRKKD